MRKLRKTGAVDPDGKVVTIPRLPSVTGVHKPTGWNRRSAAEKVEHLLGVSLDRMHDYLSWPADGLDPHRLAAQTQVIRVSRWSPPRSGVKPPASRAAACRRRACTARRPQALVTTRHVRESRAPVEG